MARVAIFGRGARDVADTVAQYVNEVLNLRAAVNLDRIKAVPSLGPAFLANAMMARDISLLDEDAELYLFSDSPLNILAISRQLLGLYSERKRENPEQSDTNGVQLAHQIIVLENMLPSWLAHQALDALYFLPAPGHGDEDYLASVADEYGATTLPPDVDLATDEVGQFVEDILGMNPGE